MGTLMCSYTWMLLSKKYYLKKNKITNPKKVLKNDGFCL